MARYLTKSRFILGSECPTKLYYTGKIGYANSKQSDDFLQALAEGGMVVGELAKLYFPEGKQVSTQDHAEALEQTRDLMQLDNVAIFEAAVAFKNLFCRIDILIKEDNSLKLIEVKSKSIDGSNHDPFRGARGEISSTWRNYLLDIGFQRYVLRNAYPAFDMSSWLMCLDKNQACTVDGLHSLFRITTDGVRSSCEFVGRNPERSICRSILKKYRVDQHIDDVCSEGFQGKNFEKFVHWLADHYERDMRIAPQIGIHCKACEFRCTPAQRREGLQDGFRECWNEALGWSDNDFDRPTVFDLYDFRRTSELIEQRRILLDDLTEEELGTGKDDEPGLHPREMQRVRLRFLKEGRREAFVDWEGLREAMHRWTYPLHFIDFETATPAIPLHRDLQPYQSLAFQFSIHTLHEDGRVTHSGEFLHCIPHAFPNFDFLRNLMRSLEGDSGTIFRYADHENTILNHIVEQLDKLGRHEEDYDSLRNFACSISRPTQSQPNRWVPGHREMVDLRKLVARHYYHIRMRGSQSIKYVLPAILTSSSFLREKYSQPNYGYEIDPHSSRNFSAKAWVQYDGEELIDPYELLPPVLDEVDKKTWDDLWTSEDIRGGGVAMAAYLRLQQVDLPIEYRSKIEKGLLRYCELDTLAMAMIVEAWRNHS